MRAAYLGRNVDVREEGKGPALVLVHGYPLDGDMWAPVSTRLAKRFRVLRPDLPARRDTPRPPAPTMAEYSSWILAVIAALGEPAAVAGFSMGGYVLFECLRKSPSGIRACAFVDTQANADDTAGRAARDASIDTAREMGPGIIARRMLPKLLSPAGRKNSQLVADVTEILRRQNPNSVENDLLAMRDRLDATSLLPQIAVPTLVIVGSEDALTPPAKSEAIARGVLGAKLVRIEGAGHLAPMEKPDEVAAALATFLSS